MEVHQKTLRRLMKGRICEYCDSNVVRVKQGYATHVRLKHPEIWRAGKILFKGPAWEWPERLGQGESNAPTFPPEEPAVNVKVTGLESFPEDLPVPTFIIKASNPFALAVLSFYRGLVKEFGIEADRIAEHVDLVVEWQKQNPEKVRIPSSKGR